MSGQTIDGVDQEVIDLIEKLMKKAASTQIPAERAAFEAKGFDLMAKHGLNQAIIEQNSGGQGRRTDDKFKGGLYHFQRDLWRSVAELNNCLYFTVYEWDKDKKVRVKARDGYYGERLPGYSTTGGYTFQHRLVGRLVNVKATQVMAEYLQQTIERLTRERLHNNSSLYFTKWAISLREGMVDQVCVKLRDRRKQLIDEEKLRQQEAAQKAREAGLVGSTGSELSLELVAKQEEDANYDFVYGEGTSARWAAERAERASARKKAEEEYAKWAAANPEQAARDEEKRRKESEKQRKRWEKKRERSYKGDAGAYWSGREIGKKVSIDQQAGGTEVAGSLT